MILAPRTWKPEEKKAEAAGADAKP